MWRRFGRACMLFICHFIASYATQATFILVIEQHRASFKEFRIFLAYQFAETANFSKEKCDNSLKESVWCCNKAFGNILFIADWRSEELMHNLFFIFFFCSSSWFQLLTSSKSSVNYITCQNLSYRSCSCWHIRRLLEGRTQDGKRRKKKQKTWLKGSGWYFYLMLLFSWSFLTFQRFVSFEAKLTTVLHYAVSGREFQKIPPGRCILPPTKAK